MNIQVGFVFTRVMAADHGVQLVSERVNYSVHLRLYRELDRTGDTYIITTNNIVTTLTSLERVAQYALLHS